MSRLLVIDDDTAIATALTVRLRAVGHEVEAASGGFEGLACAARNRPDLIVLDIRMPDLDGFEVRRRLAGDPALADVPVLFLSANVREATRDRALAVGGAAFMAKPYDPVELIATITRLLEGVVSRES